MPRHSLFKATLFLVGVLSLLSSNVLARPQVPDGWLYRQEADGVDVYFPQNQSSVVTVKFYTPKPLEGVSLSTWVSNRLGNSSPPEGHWQGESKINILNDLVVTGYRSFIAPDGEDRGVFVKAVVHKDGHVRMAANIHTRLSSYKAHKGQADRLLAGFGGTSTPAVTYDQSRSALPVTNAAPQGWQRSLTESGVVVFQPEDPQDREFVQVKYYPEVLLNGLTVERWLLNKLGTNSAPSGQWSAPATVNKLTSNASSGERRFVADTGNRVLRTFAVSVDKTYVRLAAVIHADHPRYRPYKSQAAKLMAAIFQDQKKAAVRSKRGLDLEVAPPDVQGIKKGGGITAGRYVGTKVRGNKILGRYELLLFDNGEYQFLEGERGKTGWYNYSPATGRLNIASDFYNGSYDHDEDFCIYGIEQGSGKPIVYAQDSGGLSTYVYRLYRVGDVDRPSPVEVAKQEELAEREAKRYKWVTEPGDGVRDKDIEAVLYTFDTSYTVGGLQKEEAAYLLMKDGRVMDGLPVPPDSLDVARSRSREPDRWGWWKKQGDQYLFSWGHDRKTFSAPNGTQSIAHKVRKGTRLDGDWGSSSSFAVGEFSSVSFWGVKFSSKGRFMKYQNGMTQSGGEMNGLGPLVTAAWDDDGAVTAVIGSNVGGGSRSKSNKSGSDRMGWYEFEEYSLVLKFDNGTVEYVPAFSNGESSVDMLWFGDGSLRKK